jgi:3-dehydroquinate synthase
MAMSIISVDKYHIFLGFLEAPLKEFLEKGRYSRLIVLSDDHTEAFCLPRVAPFLKLHNWTSIVIPSGEKHKNIDTCRQIWQEMMNVRADRRALVINLGGGVIGDMGGFCAATFKRGIDFVQVPTTLLSQVDASIGGKLGIDFGQVKNSIGLFRNPKAVFIDPAFLSTLPFRERRSGFAEIIKHSLIADAGQWKQLREIDNLEEVDWPALIGPSLCIKKNIVLEDPMERGLRKALNFGHTIGHAVESLLLPTPKPLLHGEAVAVGMICEAFLSHEESDLPLRDVESICNYLQQHFNPQPIAPAQFGTLLQLMANDKKNDGAGINFSLLPAIGSVKVNQVVDPSSIRRSLEYYNARVGN